MAQEIQREIVEINSIYQVHLDATELNEVSNALGYMINNPDWGNLSREQMEAIGHNTKEFAKALAPVRTGKLRDSIDYTIIGNNQSLEIYAAATDERGLGYPYGASIEYGYHPHGGSTFVPPRPFLRPALGFAVELTTSTLAESVKLQLTGLTHWGQGRKYKTWVGNRTVGKSHEMYKFKGKPNTITGHRTYLKSQHKRNLQGRNRKSTGFSKGRWKSTVWGAGRR